MGSSNSCRSMSSEEKEAATVNKAINELLQTDKRRLVKEIKLLLLGTGDSGKSTFAKQMKIIHLSGFSEQERLNVQKIIRVNIINYAQILITNTRKFEYPLLTENEEAATNLVQLKPTIDNVDSLQFEGNLSSMIKTILRDPSVQKTLERYSEYQLSDSAPYFFENLDRIAQQNYIPTEQDMLRVRTKTTGIIEVEFQIVDFVFRMVDVGGQRNERKKWIHSFEGVTAIIFVVALSEYDLLLEEAEKTNRMHESMKLFDDIVNNAWFCRTSIILLLNKKDLFEQKLKRVSLKVCFPEYEKENELQPASDYIRKQFEARNRGPKDRKIYPHVTCATDTENIKHVFIAIKDIIIRQVIDSTFYE